MIKIIYGFLHFDLVGYGCWIEINFTSTISKQKLKIKIKWQWQFYCFSAKDEIQTFNILSKMCPTAEKNKKTQWSPSGGRWAKFPGLVEQSKSCSCCHRAARLGSSCAHTGGPKAIWAPPLSGPSLAALSIPCSSTYQMDLSTNYR